MDFKTILATYMKEMRIYAMKYTNEDLKYMQEFKSLINEFNSLVKFALKQYGDDKSVYEKNLQEAGKNANIKSNGRFVMPQKGTPKYDEYLNPGASRTYSARGVFRDALLADEALVEKINNGLEDAVESGEVDITFYKSKDNILDIDDDETFLQRGTDNGRLAFNQRINQVIDEIKDYGGNVPSKVNLTDSAKGSFRTLFNKTQEKPLGEDLNSKNLSAALAVIKNLVSNHAQRPWYERFFGYFGKVGQENTTVKELMNELVGKGVDRDLLNKTIYGKKDEASIAEEKIFSNIYTIDEIEDNFDNEVNLEDMVESKESSKEFEYGEVKLKNDIDFGEDAIETISDNDMAEFREGLGQDLDEETSAFTEQIDNLNKGDKKLDL